MLRAKKLFPIPQPYNSAVNLAVLSHFPLTLALSDFLRIIEPRRSLPVSLEAAILYLYQSPRPFQRLSLFRSFFRPTEFLHPVIALLPTSDPAPSEGYTGI